MGENVGAIFFLSLGMVVVTALIIFYKLKAKELEMRGSDKNLHSSRSDTHVGVTRETRST